MSKPGTLPASLFKYFVVVAVVLAIPLAAFWIHAVYSAHLDEISTYREAYYEEQLSNLELMVNNAIDYIDHERARTRDLVNDNIRHRVDDAWAIADNLYQKFGGSLPPDKLTELIRETLRPIRYNDGRGYYFAYTLDGVAQVHALPEREGESILDLQDEDGVFIIQELIRVARDEAGGYASYRWPKPGFDGPPLPKISYARVFEPLGWIIGTGEYVEEIERAARSEALGWISQIRFEPGGYVFVGRYDGLMLSGPGAGQNTLDVTDMNGVRPVQLLIKAAKRGGGYVEYVMPAESGLREELKLSYAAPYEDWDWYVGAGVYLGDLEQVLAERRQEMVSRLLWGFLQIGGILLALFLFAWVLMKRLASRMAVAFDRFSAFFRRAASDAVELDPAEMHYREFGELAHLANEMIRQRRDALTSLVASENRMRLVLESAAEAIVGVMSDLTVTMANPSCLRLLGYEEESELLGRSFHDLVHPTDDGKPAASTELCEVCHAFRDGSEMHGTGLFQRRDGSLFPVEFWSHPVTREDSIVGGVITFLDISDRLSAERAQARLEDQLRQAQKLEAVGQLAGGVAHDFNNLLQVIMGSTDLATVRLDPEHPAQSDLEQVRKAGDRAASLVRQLLAFSRHEVISPVSLDINDLVAGFTKMLRRVIAEHIELTLHLHNGLPRVFADAGHVEQILMNLCVNARDAMPGGGEITITTSRADLVPDDPDLPPGASNKEWVLLRVEDTGKGMPAEVIEHIFEPFYTTKEVGKGTGLGLATVYGIVQQHGGFIRVSSEPDKGSCFRVFLPVARVQDEAPEDGGDEQGAEADHPVGRILLAEDDEMVRGLAVQVLEGAGHEVFVACDGNEALDLFEEHGETIDLVLLDIVMPGQSGKAVAEVIRKRRPDLPILFCSGYDFDMIKSSIAASDTHGLLMKPYPPQELLHRVGSILARV
jgi:two-component system, cell cycle sensor histidine kinase and response regulator CckA